MKSSLNKEKIQTKFEDNREMLIPIGVLFVAIVLFVAFILPSILSFPSKKGERDVEVEKLNKIKAAIDILGSTDQEELDSEVDLTSKTLPSDKNFELILEAISQAASSSNVQIAGYKYSDNGVVNPASQNSFSDLSFEIKINGEVKDAANFANALYASYPIAEVKSISYTYGLSTIVVSFYYRPFISTNAQDAALAREKTPNEAKALQEVQSWNVIKEEPEFTDIPIDESATESAEPF